MRVFPRGFCSLLELRPVAVRAQGGPLLVAVLLGRGALVGVAVRRLLNGDVEPVTALAVGEGQASHARTAGDPPQRAHARVRG